MKREYVAEVKEVSGQEIRCFNCNQIGHYKASCLNPIRSRGTCYNCGGVEHNFKECSKNRLNLGKRELKPIYQINVNFLDPILVKLNFVKCILDSGSPVSLIKESIVKKFNGLTENYNLSGINDFGEINTSIKNNSDILVNQLFLVVDFTMVYSCLLGRDFMMRKDLKIDFCDQDIRIVSVGNDSIEVDPFDEIKNILIVGNQVDESIDDLDIGSDLSEQTRRIIENMYLDLINLPKPLKPITKYQMKITLKKESPFSYQPRRLSFFEKNQVTEIIDKLLKDGIIRASNSEYSSPIVLVKKKTGDTRMCVDFRTLNKLTVRDNYPIPLIEDQLDLLHGKKYFTSLDLKSGFHQLSMHSDSIKYNIHRLLLLWDNTSMSKCLLDYVMLL